VFETRVPRGFEGWCREGELNPQGTKYRRILSPTPSFTNKLFSKLYNHLQARKCWICAVL
jgi:hypothetical protein